MKKSLRMKKRILMEKSIWIKIIRTKSILMKKVYEWKVYEFNEEQPSNVFFAKPNGKCIQPNKKVVLLTDSKYMWSNVNFEYGNVNIQL